jgi:UDPglucose--hexose-1-phosphate uridylyltransferase
MSQPDPPRRARLADGRTILYFDDPGAAQPAPRPDARDLPERSAPAELRHDRLVDEPVIVATERQGRTFLPPPDACPLCPTRDGRSTEIPDPDYDVVVFENRFPSLPAGPVDGPADGHAEVVCYSSDHDAAFASLPDERLATIARAWASRTDELWADDAVAQVFVFENRGVEIGVTLHHPHGQIYAFPYVPPRMERMVAADARRRAGGGSCLGCDLLTDELAAGDRIVAATEHGVAYVPFAARWPWEVHLVPRRHAPDLPSLGVEEREALVLLQADVIARMDRIFGRPMPYMAGWLQAPRAPDGERLHLRLEIVSPQRAADRLKYLAGSESLAGAWINDIRPEAAAARLREVPGR